MEPTPPLAQERAVGGIAHQRVLEQKVGLWPAPMREQQPGPGKRAQGRDQLTFASIRTPMLLCTGNLRMLSWHSLTLAWSKRAKGCRQRENWLANLD